jgi:predicted glycogen debranching enzyme
MEDNVRLELPEETYASLTSLQAAEWIETFGDGSYASGTYAGINTRKYHGIFNISRRAPVERIALMARLEETMVNTQDKQAYPLFSNQFPGSVTPEGYKLLRRAGKEWGPFFEYQVGAFTLIKKILAIQETKSLLFSYELIGPSDGTFELQLRPFMSGRDIHSLSKTNPFINRAVEVQEHKLVLSTYDGLPKCSISAPNIRFDNHENGWYLHFEYVEEKTRGFEAWEDLYTPGLASIPLKAGETVYLCVGEESGHAAIDPYKLEDLWKQEVSRRKKLLIPYQAAPISIKQLALSGDQFLVSRSGGHHTIIAGYHWFADWGRDTMIALPGLCLANKQYDKAKAILETFSKFVYQGMLPNRFPDQGENPEYNTVDAALWYVVAVYQYWKKTNDSDSLQRTFYPVLQSIRESYLKGTAYNIHADSDQLIYAGASGVQLTWMDAKIGDWVVTPRIGKPVEINALWYNCHKILTEIALIMGDTKAAIVYNEYAEGISKSFKEKFSNRINGALFDVIHEDHQDLAVRPNMLLALSLPFPILSIQEGRQVLNIVEEQLLTNRGLRSLSPLHLDYKKEYKGDILSRDGAYHQGTVWAWLLGPYYDACLYIRGEEGKADILKHLHKVLQHVYEAGIGSYSEIFDGSAPHKANGCISQAWSVSEILRIYKRLEEGTL